MSFKNILAQREQLETANSSTIENEAENKGSIEYVETFESSPYFGVEQVRNSPACLDLRLSNGTFKALPYIYFVEIIYDPSEGIEIITTTKKITITGRNLKLLYSFLIAYRVKFIAANIGNDLIEQKALFVQELKVEEL